MMNLMAGKWSPFEAGDREIRGDFVFKIKIRTSLITNFDS